MSVATCMATSLATVAAAPAEALNPAMMVMTTAAMLCQVVKNPQSFWMVATISCRVLSLPSHATSGNAAADANRVGNTLRLVNIGFSPCLSAGCAQRIEVLIERRHVEQLRRQPCGMHVLETERHHALDHVPFDPVDGRCLGAAPCQEDRVAVAVAADEGDAMAAQVLGTRRV